MRKSWLVIPVVSIFAGWSPVWALDAGDTMSSWSMASSAEKSKLISAFLKRDGLDRGPAGVIRCLDAASAIPGHADLPIRDLVKACEKDGGEPV